MTPCPRCGRENPTTAASCGGCRTPLTFDDPPPRSRLEVTLDLDRRRGGRSPVTPPPTPEVDPGPPGPVFQPDRSDWEIGVPRTAGVGWEEEGGASEEGEALEPLPSAPPLRRAAAWAVDGGLLGGAAMGLSSALLASTGAFERAGTMVGAYAANLPVVLPSVAFVGIAGYVYASVSHTLAGATLGKRLAGIRVVDADGHPPNLARSAVRSAWLLLSVSLAGAGLLPALLSPSRRALHDHLAGTRVVDAP